MIDGYLYDEYTKATEIVEREGECPCSVEISIESMKFDAKDKTLIKMDTFLVLLFLVMMKMEKKLNPEWKILMLN